MCPTSYHHNEFVTAHALWHKMYVMRYIMRSVRGHSVKASERNSVALGSNLLRPAFYSYFK